MTAFVVIRVGICSLLTTIWPSIFRASKDTTFRFTPNIFNCSTATRSRGGVMADLGSDAEKLGSDTDL